MAILLVGALLGAVMSNAKPSEVVDVNIVVIPHVAQRYNTVGDYWVDKNGTTQIRVSDLGDANYQRLIVVHELIELTLCRQAGVTIEMIDAFDLEFDKNRPPGDASEPGDDPRAPYYHQHQYAMGVEREMARMLGINWDVYEARIAEVMTTYPSE